jgi:uncharacterized protein YbjT (DUF2867 family)
VAGQILVTGGTGALGRVVVRRLLDAGQPVRVMSRRARPEDAGERYGWGADEAGRPCGWATADLRTGQGAAEAVAGADVIVHCATDVRREVEVAGAVVGAAKATEGTGPHLVYVSIVGVDRVPYAYYRRKLAAERLIEQSGLPYSILRATQFHDLVRVVFAVAAKSPVMPVPATRCQPVDVREVAARLTELALGDPVGRAPDFGGPRVRDPRDLAGAYLAAAGQRRAVVPVRLPGTVFRAFREGGHLAPDQAVGEIGFEQYLAEHPAPRSTSYRSGR